MRPNYHGNSIPDRGLFRKFSALLVLVYRKNLISVQGVESSSMYKFLTLLVFAEEVKEDGSTWS